jgi:hypothetical protein
MINWIENKDIFNFEGCVHELTVFDWVIINACDMKTWAAFGASPVDHCSSPLSRAEV